MSGLAASLWRLLGGLALLCCVALPLAQAHESRPAYLEIEETAAGQYEILWRTPVTAGMPLPVVLSLPEGVRNLRPPLVEQLSDSLLERRWVDAGPAGLSGQRIGFPGLELTITEAIVRTELLDGRGWMAIARPSQPWVDFEVARSWLSVAGDFFRQGVEHILYGIDHLVFVFGLVLLVRRTWMLVKTITAFTVAHSITLGGHDAGLSAIRPRP